MHFYNIENLFFKLNLLIEVSILFFLLNKNHQNFLKIILKNFITNDNLKQVLNSTFNFIINFMINLIINFIKIVLKDFMVEIFN